MWVLGVFLPLRQAYFWEIIYTFNTASFIIRLALVLIFRFGIFFVITFDLLLLFAICFCSYFSTEFLFTALSLVPGSIHVIECVILRCILAYLSEGLSIGPSLLNVHSLVSPSVMLFQERWKFQRFYLQIKMQSNLQYSLFLRRCVSNCSRHWLQNMRYCGSTWKHCFYSVINSHFVFRCIHIFRWVRCWVISFKFKLYEEKIVTRLMARWKKKSCKLNIYVIM